MICENYHKNVELAFEYTGILETADILKDKLNHHHAFTFLIDMEIEHKLRTLQ